MKKSLFQSKNILWFFDGKRVFHQIFRFFMIFYFLVRVGWVGLESIWKLFTPFRTFLSHLHALQTSQIEFRKNIFFMIFWWKRWFFGSKRWIFGGWAGGFCSDLVLKSFKWSYLGAQEELGDRLQHVPSSKNAYTWIEPVSGGFWGHQMPLWKNSLFFLKMDSGYTHLMKSADVTRKIRFAGPDTQAWLRLWISWPSD